MGGRAEIHRASLGGHLRDLRGRLQRHEGAGQGACPSQAANAYVAEQIVGFRHASKHADALAIAPFLSFNVAPDGKPSVSEVAGWNVGQVLDHLEKTSLPESEGWIHDNQKVARKYGLKLVCYEAGQHMVGVLGGENNDAVTRLLTSANRNPRMAEIYARYFDAWQREGGYLLCYFSSVGKFGKFGSWGLLEYPDDNPAQSPKYTAAIKWGRSLGQSITIPTNPSQHRPASRPARSRSRRGS